MRSSIAILALSLLSLVSTAPAPITKRALSANDTLVLQLALYLEHLETSLYTDGCDSFTDAQYNAANFPPGFRENVCVIASQEAIHAATITAILEENGIPPVPTCIYQFPYDSPTSFVDLANMITSVGIGAYLGGATLLMDDPTLLTSASAILTNEARHDSYLRDGLSASPFPSPFDTALSAVFAYNLAQQFIVSCPTPLPIIILPKLNFTSPAVTPHLTPILAGTDLDFVWDPAEFFIDLEGNTPVYVALINGVGLPVFALAGKASDGKGSVPVPSGAGNVAFAVLTTFPGGLDGNGLTNYGTLAGPAEVVLS
ncbi:hypothetical protein MMC06_003357 [Schaereria dolodes]|nr:hypothetical protein [Schaereria dolodes]